MVTRYIDSLKERPAGFLYRCDDGSQEFLPPEGGDFKHIKCADPTIHPLFVGGLLEGRRVSSLAKRAEA